MSLLSLERPDPEARAPAEATPPARPLFREQVVRSRADRLTGTVTIGMPLSWQLIGGFLLLSLAAAMVLLALTSYSEVQTVPAALSIDRGAANLVSSRPGVVTALNVAEGARVRAGEPLVTVRSEEAMVNGSTSAARAADAIRQQRLQMEAQTHQVAAQARAAQAQSQGNIEALAREVAYVDQQIEGQRQLVSTAAADIERIQTVAKNGFLSGHDMQARKDLLLSRRQQLAQLEQSRAAKLGELKRERHAAEQSSAANQAQLAQLQVGQLDLDTKLASAQASSAYVLAAPVSGVATAINVRIGDHVAAERNLMTIVPGGYRFEPELFVPTAAAGQLHLGQEVRLSVDAFPYSRYGSLVGTIREISSVPMSSGDEKGGLTYRVRVRLSERSLAEFSQAKALRPGMAMTARIVTRRQSLLRWLVLTSVAASGR